MKEVLEIGVGDGGRAVQMHIMTQSCTFKSGQKEPRSAWPRWLERCPINRKLVGLASGQGTCLVVGLALVGVQIKSGLGTYKR